MPTSVLKALEAWYWVGLTTICFMQFVSRLTEIFSNFFPESISSYIIQGMYKGIWWGITLSLLVLLVFYLLDLLGVLYDYLGFGIICGGWRAFSNSL